MAYGRKIYGDGRCPDNPDNVSVAGFGNPSFFLGNLKDSGGRMQAVFDWNVGVWA